ncbi:alpha/beta fold hydrolase [uncultured Roseobacter sp.]|uniref:esterase/lipase family protein n=1 Tax=uncultured Roseobacter sp. TaxID=114847 RepID=UPI002638180B|nr:alpha/beta fold hydrolase [uncultured Roseobacter sp.]
MNLKSLSAFVLAFLFWATASHAITFASARAENGGNTTVIFLHGFVSDARTAWQHPVSGKYWPDFFRTDFTLFSFNSAVVDYSTSLNDPRLGIDDVAADVTRELRLFLQNRPTGERIIFVGHSLGGIIARKALLEDPDIAGRTLALITLGTPMAGSRFATLASRMGFRGGIVNELQRSSDGNYLGSFTQQWVNAQRQMGIPVHCAGEERDVVGDSIGRLMVVQPFSARRTCDDFEILTDHDHQSLVKPEDTSDDIHEWLKEHLQRY